ncbi:solute carrier family 41 member 3 isoform X2 [Ovis canadensis]|uniref:solute carrier family 41 member 3 isoform X2 n=1 Tax=Ovis canadensis TaxID=37174 RepID=UPI003750A29E
MQVTSFPYRLATLRRHRNVTLPRTRVCGEAELGPRVPGLPEAEATGSSISSPVSGQEWPCPPAVDEHQSRLSGPSCAPAAAMETRQRRPEELGLLQALSARSGADSPRAAPTPPGPELSGETAWCIGSQVALPFLLAGLGLSGAGLLLHYFQHWPVFTEMKDLLTLVPPLVGLKGNLEMTLASRLSTAANTGQVDDPQEQYRVVSSNLALVQVQAAVVGLLAAVAALLLGLASGQGLDVVEAQVLCASSVLTASLAACALGTLMVCIVVGARKLGVNPDNIATPIAASLGDLTTLSLLAVVSSFFYRHRDSQYLTPLVFVGFAALTPACVLVAKQNPPVVRILKFGWFPIVLAMLVSSLGGLILNKTLSRPQFRGMAVFAPIICDICNENPRLLSSPCAVRLRCPGSHPGGPESPLSVCRRGAPGPTGRRAGRRGAVRGAGSGPRGLHLQAPLPQLSSESSGAAQAVGLHPGRGPPGLG